MVVRDLQLAAPQLPDAADAPLVPAAHPSQLAVYMVRDFQLASGGDTGEGAVGRLTGLLAATFCAAQLVTSYPWGMLSDRIGRKVGGWVGGWVAARGRAAAGTLGPAGASAASSRGGVLLRPSGAAFGAPAGTQTGRLSSRLTAQPTPCPATHSRSWSSAT